MYATTRTTTTATAVSATRAVSHKTRRSVAVCAKKGGGAEQPQWFEEAKVFCNGQEVMTVGGTQAEYVVDIWSGNHPFFQGRSSAIMTDAGQVSRFANRFGDLGDLSAVETMDTPATTEDK